MDEMRFDRFARFLAAAPSRRLLLRSLATLGLAVKGSVPDTASAKKRKQKLKFNEFGCVNVGGKCRGKDSACCSGICQGKRPKKGKKDTRRCVGHDPGDCQAGHIGTKSVDCTTSSGSAGVCYTTTGNGIYCAKGGFCTSCRKDADCQAFCGPEAACIPYECANPISTACVGISGCNPP